MRRLAAFLLCSAAIVPPAPADEPSFTRKEDVIYGRKFGMALTMDVFRPTRDANGLGIILVASGGWVSSRDMIQPGTARPMLDRGDTGLAPGHRSPPPFTLP